MNRRSEKNMQNRTFYISRFQIKPAVIKFLEALERRHDGIWTVKAQVIFKYNGKEPLILTTQQEDSLGNPQAVLKVDVSKELFNQMQKYQNVGDKANNFEEAKIAILPEHLALDLPISINEGYLPYLLCDSLTSNQIHHISGHASMMDVVDLLHYQQHFADEYSRHQIYKPHFIATQCAFKIENLIDKSCMMIVIVKPDDDGAKNFSLIVGKEGYLFYVNPYGCTEIDDSIVAELSKIMGSEWKIGKNKLPMLNRRLDQTVFSEDFNITSSPDMSIQNFSFGKSVVQDNYSSFFVADLVEHIGSNYVDSQKAKSFQKILQQAIQLGDLEGIFPKVSELLSLDKYQERIQRIKGDVVIKYIRKLPSIKKDLNEQETLKLIKCSFTNFAGRREQIEAFLEEIAAGKTPQVAEFISIAQNDLMKFIADKNKTLRVADSIFLRACSNALQSELYYMGKLFLINYLDFCFLSQGFPMPPLLSVQYSFLMLNSERWALQPSTNPVKQIESYTSQLIEILQSFMESAGDNKVVSLEQLKEIALAPGGAFSSVGSVEAKRPSESYVANLLGSAIIKQRPYSKGGVSLLLLEFPSYNRDKEIALILIDERHFKRKVVYIQPYGVSSFEARVLAECTEGFCYKPGAEPEIKIEPINLPSSVRLNPLWDCRVNSSFVVAALIRNIKEIISNPNEKKALEAALNAVSGDASSQLKLLDMLYGTGNDKEEMTPLKYYKFTSQIREAACDAVRLIPNKQASQSLGGLFSGRAQHIFEFTDQTQNGKNPKLNAFIATVIKDISACVFIGEEEEKDKFKAQAKRAFFFGDLRYLEACLLLLKADSARNFIETNSLLTKATQLIMDWNKLYPDSPFQGLRVDHLMNCRAIVELGLIGWAKLYGEGMVRTGKGKPADFVRLAEKINAERGDINAKKCDHRDDNWFNDELFFNQSYQEYPMVEDSFVLIKLSVIAYLANFKYFEHYKIIDCSTEQNFKKLEPKTEEICSGYRWIISKKVGLSLLRKGMHHQAEYNIAKSLFDELFQCAAIAPPAAASTLDAASTLAAAYLGAASASASASAAASPPEEEKTHGSANRYR